MTITEAITAAGALTGQVFDTATLTRWLSELDGRLAFEFYRAEGWAPYDPTDDSGAELLVPFPWDGLYVHHLAARTYFANGEYDRYENERVMGEKTLSDFRSFMQRTQARLCSGGFPTEKTGGSDVTVIPAQSESVWFWLSAYSLAVKHGFSGTEEEWLASLAGPAGEDGADGADGADGVSPAVSVAAVTGGHSVTITDADHPAGQSFHVMDGEDGADGADGVSPEVSITGITGGHTVTITDADHPAGQSFNVMDGEAGTPYAANPAMDGTADPGSSADYARGDHVHPSDTAKADKTDLAGIRATGSTNATGAAIGSGTYFYLNGVLVRAKADIATGAAFTSGTNYETVTAGALNELKSAIPKLETDTWVPEILSGGSGWINPPAYSVYQKYGAIVTVSLLGWSTQISNPNSSHLHISLPFRVANTRYGVGSSFGYVSGSLTRTKTVPMCIHENGSSFIYFAEPASPDDNILTGDGFGTNTWQMSLTYLTDE